MKYCDAILVINETEIYTAKHRRELPFMRLMLFSIILSFVFALATPSTILAQGQGRPDCENDRSVSGCIDEMLTEQSLMIDEVEGLLDDMSTMGMFSLGQRQFGLTNQSVAMEADILDRITTLRNQNGRAKEANDASTDAEYEEMIAESDKGKDKKENCKDSDINFFNSLEDEGFLPPGFLSVDIGKGKDKFGNEKCDVFAAVDLDGNDVTVNERTENMCETICKFKENAGGNSRKGETKRRVVNSLLDAKFTAGVARQNLSLQRAQMALMKPQIEKIQLSALNSTALTTDACNSGFDVPALLEIISTGVSILNSAVSFTTAALETAKDNVKPAANQTVAGFNAGATVIPFALVAGISKMTGEVIGGIEKVLTIAAQIVSAFQDETLLNCITSVGKEFEGPDGKIVKLQDAASQLQTDATSIKGEFEGPDGKIIKLQEAVSLLQASSGQTNAELALVKTELALIKSNLAEVDTLLRTPQGQRSGFSGN
jgi:hypothetical protein